MPESLVGAFQEISDFVAKEWIYLVVLAVVGLVFSYFLQDCREHRSYSHMGVWRWVGIGVLAIVAVAETYVMWAVYGGFTYWVGLFVGFVGWLAVGIGKRLFILRTDGYWEWVLD